MAHKHSIYDCDTHFAIDLKTREIKNDIGKTVIVQNDHNSERFSFELPKEIEGHDMSLCNVVQVHFVNTDSQTKEKHGGLYTVDDLQISPDGNDVVILSWLLSQEATRAVGSLYFGIVFKCIEEDGTLTYSWHTTVNKDFKVVESLDNSNVIIEEYPDVLAQLEARLAAVEQGGTGGGGSGGGLTEEQAADLAANTEARHTHENSNVLDRFSLDDFGTRPQFMGFPLAYVDEWSSYTELSEDLIDECLLKTTGNFPVGNFYLGSNNLRYFWVQYVMGEIQRRMSEHEGRTATIEITNKNLYGHTDNSIMSLMAFDGLTEGKEIVSVELKADENSEWVDLRDMVELDGIPYSINGRKTFMHEQGFVCFGVVSFLFGRNRFYDLAESSAIYSARVTYKV